jgi:hypothetical protein
MPAGGPSRTLLGYKTQRGTSIGLAQVFKNSCFASHQPGPREPTRQPPSGCSWVVHFTVYAVKVRVYQLFCIEGRQKMGVRPSAGSQGGEYDLSNPVGSFVEVVRRVVSTLLNSSPLYLGVVISSLRSSSP